MRRLCPFALASLCSTGCADEAQPLDPGEAHFSVALDDDGIPTGRLVGWNVGRGTLYSLDNDGVHPEWRTPERVAAFAQLAEIRDRTGRAPRVRFSGLQIDGALGGDGYHFWTFARPDRETTPTDNMAAYQWMAIVEEVGAEALATVNFGSGTADEARRYADHLSGTGASPEVDARASWGFPQPWPIAAYELGNEVYGPWNTGFTATSQHGYANPGAPSGGDPEWHGRPSREPADYAARALAYADAITAVDPDARFWIPFGQASLETWGGPAAALAGLEPLLVDPRVEAIVVHHYQVDDAATLGALDVTAPAISIAGGEVFRPLYLDLRERLAALPRATPLAIAVTEYHVAGAFTFGAYDGLADSPLVGLGVADVLILFAQLGIDHAAQHMAVAFGDEAAAELLFEPWYNPLRVVAGTVVPRPSYVATRLFAEHVHARTILPTAETVPNATHTDGAFALEYPLVHAVAFVGEDEGSIVLLSRDLEAERTVTFDLPTGWRAVEASMWAPDVVDAPIGDTPLEIETSAVEQVGTRVALVAPPHALVALALVRS